MRFLRTVAAAGLAALVAAAPAAAQQQPAISPDVEQRIKLAGDLIEMLTLSAMMQQLSATLTAGFTQVYTQQQTAQKATVTDAQRKTIDEVVRVNLAKKLPDLIRVLAPLTAQALTTEELKAVLDFYKSPVGQKIAQKLPALQREQARRGDAWMQQNSEGIQRQILADLEQKGVKIQLQQAQQPAAPKQN